MPIRIWRLLSEPLRILVSAVEMMAGLIHLPKLLGSKRQNAGIPKLKEAKIEVASNAGFDVFFAPELDLLLVRGGFGQQDLMTDEEVLCLIRSHCQIVIRSHP